MIIQPTRWQDATWPDQVDCIITDPPYSERTHSGNNGGRRKVRDAARHGNSAPIRQIEYASLTPADCHEWAAAWAPRVRYWLCVMCDHVLIPAWYDAFAAAGLYAFAPLSCLIPGMTCRLTGDGPASWTVYLMVARHRTREARTWGALPGGYVSQPGAGPDRGAARIGGKPLPLMQQIIRDYSRPGMMVADPCAGHGTTLVAARGAGRQVWGAECDPEAAAIAEERVQAVVPAPLLDGGGEQVGLFT